MNPGSDRTNSDDAVEIARSLAREVLARHPVRGLAWGVVRDGTVLATGGVGRADVDAALPAGPAVASRICSITKTMTAVAIMQLVEEGAVAIDDPVNRHLHGFRVDHPDPHAPPVRLRDLLTHTAGIGDIHRVKDLRRPFAGLAVRAGRPVPTLRELYGPWFRTEVHAGTKWNYANHGFAILGQVVEDVRGESFAAVLRERLFDPLGMDRTDTSRSDRTGPDRFVGYKSATRRARRRARPGPDIELTVAPTGGVWSTVDDLLRYATELLDPTVVLAPATVATMTTPHWALDPRLVGRGLGLRLSTHAGHRVFGHDGAIPGWTSTLQCYPDDGLAFVAVANANTPAIGAAVHRLGIDTASALLDLPSVEADLAARTAEGPTSALAEELAGPWQVGPGLLTSVRMLMNGGRRLQVERRRDGSLAIRTRLGTYKGGIPLVPVDADDPLRFDALTAGLRSSMAFARNADGVVDRLLVDDVDGPLELFRA